MPRRLSSGLLRSAALALAISSLWATPAFAQEEEAAAVAAAAPLDLAALTGEWQLVAVLGASAGQEPAPVADIDWAHATARFHLLFEAPTELHATFVGPPLSAAGAVAGGSLVLDDPSRGTLRLTSEQPTPITKLLRQLDAGLLPNAFVVGETPGAAQYVYVRAELDPSQTVAALVQQASERASLPVVASQE